MEFLIEKEPGPDTIRQITAIAQDYTSDYFTENVPENTKNDLQFQRAAYLKEQGEIVSFIVFTCLDGCPHITLLATKRTYRAKGYGTILMEAFVSHVQALGFHCIEVMTVLPDSKPVYRNTVEFYLRMGFVITDTYPDLWETGAIKLKKSW